MSTTIETAARWISVAALAAALGGCTGLSEAECRGADWYALGYRDARFKLQSQDSVYAQQCERYGARIDAQRYAQGLREGRYDFPDRMM
jgi:hypothetical protein